MSKNIRNLIVCLIVFLIGSSVGYYFRPSHVSTLLGAGVRENSPQYTFINPLLFSDDAAKDQSNQSKQISKVVSDYIANAQKQNSADDISVYFRDANSGRWTGVNEDEKFSPGSMFKIAILLATLQKAESDSKLLSQEIEISPQSVNLNPQEYYKPAHPIVAGKVYTVEDLLSHMIIDSDNNAANALDSFVGDTSIQKTLTEFQMPTVSASSTYLISPKMFSRFFRVLYNSSYVSRADSEAALKLLSQSTFDKGLVAGVPSGTLVAHKFGELSVADDSGKIVGGELHDCGIVYYPDAPYLLCIMTRGSDRPSLEKTIADISGLIWNTVSQTK